MARERPPDWAPAGCLNLLRVYREHATREVERVKRNLNGMSEDDKEELSRKPEEQVKELEEALAANLLVLGGLEEVMMKEKEIAKAGPTGVVPAGTKPVQALLQTLVREWSAEGLQERKTSYDKILTALDTELKEKLEKTKTAKEAAPCVCIPGASVGRVAFEVSARGYQVEACEGRALQWFGMELLRCNSSLEALKPQPFSINTCNRLKFKDNVRVTAMPEVAIKDGMLPEQRFGQFADLYDTKDALGRFDALLTEYSLDLSPNVFRFIRTAAHVVKPGGAWVNFGPLAYDADHDEAAGHGLELSWEELKFAIGHFFEIKEEDWHDALHAQNAESLMQMQYTCIYFKAIRNQESALGIGEKKDPQQ